MDARVRLLTPEGIGGIAVVELTGSAAPELVQRCFRGPRGASTTVEPRRIYYGHIVDRDETLDEVLVTCVRAADGAIVEINCHGGVIPARRVIRHLVEQGAVENGIAEVVTGRKLKRLEREVLGQLVRARTQLAAEVLLVQLSGKLRAELEGIVADPDDEDARRRIAALRATYTYGRRFVDAATVVITGAPNVGKSTLANGIVGRERSIVHHLPGTTRDAVTSVASLDGLPCIVVDTAGLRQATGEIERIGVERAMQKAASGEVIVWVFDHSRGVTDDEVSYLNVLRKRRLVPVINKIDLDGPVEASQIRRLVGAEVQRTCALTGEGTEELGRRIFTCLVGSEVPPRDSAVVTTREVAAALDEAAREVQSGSRGGCLFDGSLLA
ncbi:MAG: hypothetical protein AMS16_02170 [Planctomycetes bacterium DG_58]|nr:MAG: hypothetical protein AMS16_02170 [Planctomycetes bacterium DG_58]